MKWNRLAPILRRRRLSSMPCFSLDIIEWKHNLERDDIARTMSWPIGQRHLSGVLCPLALSVTLHRFEGRESYALPGTRPGH